MFRFFPKIQATCSDIFTGGKLIKVTVDVLKSKSKRAE